MFAWYGESKVSQNEVFKYKQSPKWRKYMISNSDLMSGLMVIFLFISVAFVRQEAPVTIGEENVSKNYLQGLLQLENQTNIGVEEELQKKRKKGKWRCCQLNQLV